MTFLIETFNNFKGLDSGINVLADTWLAIYVFALADLSSVFGADLLKTDLASWLRDILVFGKVFFEGVPHNYLDLLTYYPDMILMIIQLNYKLALFSHLPNHFGLISFYYMLMLILIA